MNYTICDLENNIVGRVLFDTNKDFKECIFRSIGVHELGSVIMDLQNSGVFNYEKVSESKVNCYVKKYKVLLNTKTSKMEVECIDGGIYGEYILQKSKEYTAKEIFAFEEKFSKVIKK